MTAPRSSIRSLPRRPRRFATTRRPQDERIGTPRGSGAWAVRASQIWADWDTPEHKRQFRSPADHCPWPESWWTRGCLNSLLGRCESPFCLFPSPPAKGSRPRESGAFLQTNGPPDRSTLVYRWTHLREIPSGGGQAGCRPLLASERRTALTASPTPEPASLGLPPSAAGAVLGLGTQTPGLHTD